MITRSLSQLIPRLRRFGRLMMADPERADLCLLDTLRTLPKESTVSSDLFDVARSLYPAVIAGFEREARAMKTLAVLRSVPGTRPPLLPAFWSLPYEERLAVCLLVVDELDPSLAGRAASVPARTLEAWANRALARLNGDLPLRGRSTIH